MSPSSEALAESRRVLRALLSRREFLTVSGSLAAGIGGLAITGCSSGADGPTVGTSSGPSTPKPTPTPPPQLIPDGFSTVTGTVTLPTGSKLKPSELKVEVGTQVIPVSATGTFTAGVATVGPSLALLTDASGDGVLMAMFSGGAAASISPRTTAVSLLYYATAAFTLPPSLMTQALALLNNDPAIAALESAVATAVAADARALINNAAPLGPAIASALLTILGAPTAPDAPARVQSLAVPTLMLIQPSAAKNGIGVNQDDATTSLLVSNTKRRGGKVYVYQTSNKIGDTVDTKNPVVREAGPIELASTESISVINLLKDLTTYFYGSSPFQPVMLPAIPLILKPSTADQTIYSAVVVTASWKVLTLDALEPAFFHLPVYAQERDGWRSEAQTLFNNAIFGDLLLPLFCFLGGIGAITASRGVIAGVIAEAAATKASTFTWVLSNLKVGSVRGVKAAMQTIVNDAFSSDLSAQFWKPAMQGVVGEAQSRALKAESQVLTQSRWIKGAKMFEKIFAPLFALGSVAEAWDFGAVIFDTFNSDLASLWEVTLTRQKLGLTPENPRIAAGDRVNFTVDLPANVTGTYTYEWTQTSLFAKLSAVGETNVGTNITTTKRAVDLVTTGSDATPISVLVVAYDTRKLPREEIGRAGTTVSFLYPAEILPSNATLLVNQSQPFSVIVTGLLPTDVAYKWTLIGQNGTLGGQASRTTNVPQVTFNAGTVPGTATLHVDVVNGAGVRFAKADAPVTVEFPAVILPANAVIGLGALQLFSVSVTGQLPADIVYKWTLTGQAGSLGGQALRTTTTPQVTFNAGAVAGTCTLHVDVVNGAGVRFAKADASVIVERAPSITFTIAGPWDQAKMAPNGTYNYPGGNDGRYPSEGSPGIDTLFFAYNIGTREETIGVGLAVEIPSSRVLRTGDIFNRVVMGTTGLNGFQFVLAKNQADPDDPNTNQYVPPGTGTLKFDSVGRLANGTWIANYSFAITNSGGGTIVGAGAARWT